MLPPPQKKPDFAAQQDTPVMQEMKRQRGQAPRMEVIDILKQTVGKQGKNPIQVYNAMADLVNNDPDFRIMRANNTLFAYNNNKDGSVDFSYESADDPQSLADSIKQFSQAMKVAGFKIGRFDVEDAGMLNAFKQSGVNMKTRPSGSVMDDGRTPALIGMVEF